MLRFPSRGSKPLLALRRTTQCWGLTCSCSRAREATKWLQRRGISGNSHTGGPAEDRGLEGVHRPIGQCVPMAQSPGISTGQSLFLEVFPYIITMCS